MLLLHGHKSLGDTMDLFPDHHTTTENRGPIRSTERLAVGSWKPFNLVLDVSLLGIENLCEKRPLKSFTNSEPCLSSFWINLSVCFLGKIPIRIFEWLESKQIWVSLLKPKTDNKSNESYSTRIQWIKSESGLLGSWSQRFYIYMGRFKKSACDQR